MTRHRPSFVFPALLALAVSVPAVGYAQTPLLFDRNTGTCVDEDLTPCTTPGSPCGDGSEGTCVSPPTGTPFCLPPRRTACCTDVFGCPTGDASVTYECRLLSDLSVGAGPGGICAEAGRTYCGIATVDQIDACHTAPDDPSLTVRWLAGDCDQDGTANGRDPRPCLAATPRGIFDEENGCVAVQVGCGALGDSCQLTQDGPSGDCLVSDDGLGLQCIPGGGRTSVLYCANPDLGLECLEAEAPITLTEGVFCAPTHCAPAGVDLGECITDAAGAPVPYDDGDCDGDGESNKDEVDSGDRDPCVDERFLDAGLPPTDAGEVVVDAGEALVDAGEVLVDAGEVSMDAGGTVADGGATPVEPRFEGGGGCSCRASGAGGDRRAGGGLGALALVGLALARRRRR